LTARIERHSSFSMILSSLLASLSWNGTRVGPTAAVERAHSYRARSGSKGSARVSFHPFHRARSASKKGTWPLPTLPSHSRRWFLCCSAATRNLKRRVRKELLVIQQLHDDLGCLEEIVLFSLGNPKLRLNSRHTVGQFLIRFGYFGIEQMPK
jgi:hypothetical protein